MSLLHGHLEPWNRNSTRPALSPSLICSSLSFSPRHTNIYFGRKRSDSRPQERRIGRRVVSANVKTPKQRARRMSGMVYGVWGSSLRERLQRPAFFSGFSSPRSAEQTNQGGGSQARERQSRGPIISPPSPLKTQKHSEHLCVHNRK